ncbi:hypothetical protein GH714_040087 [Hevea brasiliensis]|uniref:DYW domain-containing protein n=1 Tax=Hevea brasiliensis TaxID=3981 RepID=A0A6A6MT21_HEVBR|nr:hypothetical protein GH714_040087 [Hevea brasiliensis]
MLEEGLEPDDVIYVGVLSACSRAGLVEEGLQCFNRMKFEHGIEPTIQHYCCIVDLMGRAGMLNEALEFIRTMPIDPNDIVWRSLLSACKAHHNLKIGEIATKSLVPLILHNPSDLLILSHMYARAKKWEDSAMVRTELACQHLHQTPGFSLVEVKRKIYRFVSQDMSHPESEDIYEMIHQMEWQLKFEGYSPDTSQILLDVDEEEKRQRLKAHSQKLAIAFALIHASQGIPIRITRNLRMCNDCHTYTKSISKIYTREIITKVKGQNQGQMLVKVDVHSTSMVALVDTGVNTLYMSKQLVDKIKLPYEKVHGLVKGVTAKSMPIYEVARDVDLQIGQWHGKVDVTTAPLNEKQLYLGIDFLRKVQAPLVPYVDTIYILQHRQPYYMPIKREYSGGNVILAMQLSKGLKRNEPTFLVAFKDDEGH